MARSPGTDVQYDAGADRGVDGAGQREIAYRIFAGCPNLVMDLQIDGCVPEGITGSGEYRGAFFEQKDWFCFRFVLKRSKGSLVWHFCWPRTSHNLYTQDRCCRLYLTGYRLLPTPYHSLHSDPHRHPNLQTTITYRHFSRR